MRLDLTETDVAIISETKWNSELEDSILQIPGYQLAARADRKPNGRGGGCCIYVKNNILYSDVIQKNINWSIQLCAVKIKDVYIIGLYRRPHFNTKADIQLLNFMRQQFDGKRIILSGDANLRDLDWTQNVICDDNKSDEKRSLFSKRNALWQEFQIEMSYEQLIDQPTHNLGGLLDIVITNLDSGILRSKPEVDFVTFRGFSDHAGIIFETNIMMDNQEALRTVFDYKNCDWSKLTECIIDSNIDGIYTDHNDSDSKWVHFRNTVLTSRHKICPMKKVGYSQKSPWITKNLRTLLRKERRMRRNACKYHTSDIHHLRARRKWAKIKDFVHEKVRLARLEYESKVITSLKFNNNAIHNHFKQMNTSNTPPPLKDADGNLVTNEKERCDIFQDHFIAIFGNKKPEVGKVWNNDGKLTNIDFSIERLKKVITKMRLNSAPGVDSIGSNIYKKCFTAVAFPLLEIFRTVMSTSMIPLDWQLSKVSPLYKGSGSKSDLKRWRPLSLGCTGLRVFERMVEVDLRQIVEESGILPDYQHGFRKKKSTITNLLSSWNYLVNHIDKNDSRNILSMDGSCAFDILKIDYILDQVEKIGISGLLGKFLEKWLIVRYQFVQLGTSTSYLSKVHAGVPQGSVLGPLLFILASGSGLADIEKDVNIYARSLGTPEVKLYVYADDIKGVFSLKNIEEKMVVEHLLVGLENYSFITGLRFNATKSQILRLGNEQLQCDLSLVNQIIPEVRYLKDLGVLFSKTYTFVSMMKVQIAKARNIIRKVRHNLIVRDPVSLKMIYQSYFQSTLLYGSEVWLNIEDSTLSKLYNIDDSFWALLPAQYDRPICRNSVQVAVRKNLMLYFKHKYDICKMDLTEDFYEIEQNLTRNGGRNQLRPPKCRLSVKSREFTSVTTKLFNKLNHEKRKTTLINNFSREVDRMIDEQFSNA